MQKAPIKTPPVEGFQKERALDLARKGLLARPLLLQVLDNGHYLGITDMERGMFELALRARDGRGPNPVIPRIIEVPDAPSTATRPERVKWSTYTPHDTPPVIVPPRKRQLTEVPRKEPPE